MSVQKITVTADEEGQRLDRWFRSRFPQVTHGRLEKLLRKGEIRVNGGRVRANLRLEAGMVVRIPPLPKPEDATRPGPVSHSDAVALRDRILYRDDVLIAIDKPAGLAVQGGSGTTRHLDGMLDILQFDAQDRPRLVHRLDRDTSGVLILARTRSAATVLTFGALYSWFGLNTYLFSQAWQVPCMVLLAAWFNLPFFRTKLGNVCVVAGLLALVVGDLYVLSIMNQSMSFG